MNTRWDESLPPSAESCYKRFCRKAQSCKLPGAQMPKVLLVGRRLALSGFLSERLSQLGCECVRAECYRDAVARLEETVFDFVLSEIHLPDSSATPLMARLEKSATTLYYCVGVHHGSWWLPAVERGRTCWGEPALRPSEFGPLLMRSIAEAAEREKTRVAVLETLPPACPPESVAPVPILLRKASA